MIEWVVVITIFMGDGVKETHILPPPHSTANACRDHMTKVFFDPQSEFNQLLDTLSEQEQRPSLRMRCEKREDNVR